MLPPDDCLIDPGTYPRGHWENNASCVEQLNPICVLVPIIRALTPFQAPILN